MPSAAPLISRAERLFTAALLAGLLASALMALYLAPKVRGLFHQAGRPLPAVTRWALAPAYWPAVTGAAVACAAITFSAASSRRRNAALATGLLVCLSAATFYAGALSAEVDVTSLLLEDNPLSGPLKTDPPDRWDRSR